MWQVVESCSISCDLLLQVSAELLQKSSLHHGVLTAAFSPAYILVNRTPHRIMVQAQRGWRGKQLVDLPSCCWTTIDSEHSQPLIFWYQNTSKSASYLVQVTADEGLERWSIPISLNFVRRSFSLPLSQSSSPDACPLSNSALVVSTHSVDGVLYVVLSTDPSPRLLVSNCSPLTLELREASSRGLNVAAQVLPAGESVSYEPPTLARQYPLIAGSGDADIQLTEIENILLQLRALRQDNEEENSQWSSPFPLNSGLKRMTLLPGPASTRVLVSVAVELGRVSVTLLPFEASSSPPSVASPSRWPLELTVRVQQLVVCVDCEDWQTLMVRPVLKMIGDHITVNYTCSSTEQHKLEFIIRSLQLDNIAKSTSSSYPVVALPRYDHNPPAQLIKKEFPPFLRFTLNRMGSAVIQSFSVSVQPVTVQVDNAFIAELMLLVKSYQPPFIPHQAPDQERRGEGMRIPSVIVMEAERDRHPLVVGTISADPCTVFLSARISMMFSASCDDMPLHLPGHTLRNIYSNWVELLQSLGSHYTSVLLVQAGWLLGSLDVIGSPGLVLHQIRTGLQDFFLLPYEGLTRGPGLFVLGLGQGVSALISNVSTGALRSLTNFASSMAENMERLSLDPDHAAYQEQLRRQGGSRHLGSGIITGASGLGLSLVSAVAGVVDQPMRSVQMVDDSAGLTGYLRSMLTGFGKGLLGVVTKPVGGAFQLVSQTGQGFMNSTGLLQRPAHRKTDQEQHCLELSRAVQPSIIGKHCR